MEEVRKDDIGERGRKGEKKKEKKEEEEEKKKEIITPTTRTKKIALTATQSESLCMTISPGNAYASTSAIIK